VADTNQQGTPEPEPPIAGEHAHVLSPIEVDILVGALRSVGDAADTVPPTRG
jgi:hypothetical protein